MLSGVLIKAVGIYVIIRLFFNMFELTESMSVLITTLGTLSMVIGVFLAIGQWDIKRLLAYHSISQMGYVVLSVGMGMILISRGERPEIAVLAIAGGLFHLVNHAAFKGLLFLNAGAIEYTLGTRDLKEMGGLGKINAGNISNIIYCIDVNFRNTSFQRILQQADNNYCSSNGKILSSCSSCSYCKHNHSGLIPEIPAICFL